MLCRWKLINTFTICGQYKSLTSWRKTMFSMSTRCNGLYVAGFGTQITAAHPLEHDTLSIAGGYGRIHMIEPICWSGEVRSLCRAWTECPQKENGSQQLFASLLIYVWRLRLMTGIVCCVFPTIGPLMMFTLIDRIWLY